MILHEKEEIVRSIDRSGKFKDLNPSYIDSGREELSYASGNAFESMAKTNPEYFNRAKLIQLQSCKNITEGFDTFFNEVIMQDIPKLSNVDFEKINIGDQDILNQFQFEFNTSYWQGINNDIILLMQKYQMNAEDATKLVMEKYIPDYFDEAGVRKMIQIRIKKNRILTDSLTKMLKLNYAAFNLSQAEASTLIKDLEDDNKNHEAIGKIKEFLKNPKLLEKFKKGNNYDFTSIGGGWLFLSNTVNIQMTQHPSRNLERIFKYDAIVVGHGDFFEDEGTWASEPISTLKKSNMDNVLDIVYQLRKEGFKNVFIGNCNPGGVKMPKDIVEDKNFKVTYGIANMYLENDFYNSKDYKILNESEMRLNDLLNELKSPYRNYSLNELYNEYDRIEKQYAINEGVVDTVKTFCRKAVQIIVEIWKRIIQFFKNIFSRIYHVFQNKFGKKSSVKLEKPIEANLIVMNGNKAEVRKVQITSTDKIIKSIQEANKSINIVISRSSNEETQWIKKLQSMVDSGKFANNKPPQKEEEIKESTLFKDIVFI